MWDVIQMDSITKNKDDEVIFTKELTTYEITTSIINRIKDIDKKKKILYFNYSYTEDELKQKFKIFNNKNIIIVDKPSVTVDGIDKYLKYSKPDYVCIDYFKMTRIKRSLKIGNKSLKYTLGKLKKYMNKYNTIFIVVINEESK